MALLVSAAFARRARAASPCLHQGTAGAAATQAAQQRKLKWQPCKRHCHVSGVTGTMQLKPTCSRKVTSLRCGGLWAHRCTTTADSKKVGAWLLVDPEEGEEDRRRGSGVDVACRWAPVGRRMTTEGASGQLASNSRF